MKLEFGTDLKHLRGGKMMMVEDSILKIKNTSSTGNSYTTSNV